MINRYNERFQQPRKIARSSSYAGFVSLFCRRCEASFDSDDDDPRCPQCLRKTSVIDPSAPSAGGTSALPARPFWPRFAVAFPSCALLFLGLTFTTSFGGIELTWALRVYAALLGGMLLGLPATLFQLPGMFAAFGPRPPVRP